MEWLSDGSILKKKNRLLEILELILFMQMNMTEMKSMIIRKFSRSLVLNYRIAGIIGVGGVIFVVFVVE